MSDLHLGTREYDRCTSSTEQIIALLDELERRCERVVLLGDTFDLLRPRRARSWSSRLERIRQERPELVRRLEACHQIVGNHDAPLAALGVPEELDFVGASRRAVLIHGHQWDVWLKRVWGLEGSANFIAGWCDRAGFEAISSWMGEVPRRLGARRVGGERGQGEGRRFELGAELELERGFDVIAYGHTHALGLFEMAHGKLAINAGSHAHGWRDAAALDLDQGWALALRDGVAQQAASVSPRGRWRVHERGEAGFEEVLERWRG